MTISELVVGLTSERLIIVESGDESPHSKLFRQREDRLDINRDVL